MAEVSGVLELKRAREIGEEVCHKEFYLHRYIHFEIRVCGCVSESITKHNYKSSQDIII